MEHGGSPHAPMTLGRALALWLGSFLIVAMLLIVWCRAPIGPLILAGGVTVVGTILRTLYAQRRFRS